MVFKNKIFRLFALLALSTVLVSWGYSGHNKISTESGQSFNAEMDQFMVWVSVLAAHASDADNRKDIDPNEGPKHYIDIDNYPTFQGQGRIPQTWDSVVSLYGGSFVIDQGILPWATITSYDSLVNCFLRRDWAKAVLFASDLGHYVADGYMPMHITRNYNGQFTGNSGIHSRYESGMVNTYLSQIIYSGNDIAYIPDVNAYIFDYLYTNYVYVDSVLIADNYARTLTGSTSSSAYKEALWNKSKSFTIPLFSGASTSLAELIYTAWVEAGKPSMSSEGIDDTVFESSFSLDQNFPNPLSNTTEISFFMKENANISLEVLDASGKTISLLTRGLLQRGEHNYIWNASDTLNGLYYLVLKCGNQTQVRKMVVLR